MLMADQAPKSWLAGARRDGSACRDNPEPASSPCSACNVPVRGWALPSAGGRCSGYCLVGVAAKAADLKIEIFRVQSVAEARRGLSWSFETVHALVPYDTRQTVSFLPSLGRALRRMPNRTAVDAFARFGAHQGKNAPAWRRSASRYGLGLCEWDTQGRGKGRGNVGDSRHIGNNAPVPLPRGGAGLSNGYLYRRNHLRLFVRTLPETVAGASGQR
jgi:hypothetical protein